jgi:hypothetical protein
MQSFLIGTVVSVLLLRKQNKNLKILGGFFLFVSLMQFFDWIFWTYPSGNVNKITTKFASVFNHLQPLVLAALVLYYKKRLMPINIFIGAVYTVLTLVYMFKNFHNLDTTVVTDKSKPGLYWSWNHWQNARVVYAIFLILLVTLASELDRPYSTIAVIITVSSFLFSYYKFQVKFSTGRIWCFLAALAPIVFLTVDKV